MDGVQTDAAVERIGPGAAGDRVVAAVAGQADRGAVGRAVERVVAAAAEDGFIGRGDVVVLVDGAVVEVVVERDAHGRVAIRVGDRVQIAAADERVAAGAAVEGVVAGVAFEAVVAAAADERIISAGADEGD